MEKSFDNKRERKTKSRPQIIVTAHNFSQLSPSTNIMCKLLFIPSLAHFRTHLILKSLLKAEQLKNTFCYI